MTRSSDAYYSTRFSPDPRRARLWAHLTRYLAQFVPPDADVLELGAGYCHFINHVPGRRRIAVDLGDAVVACAAPGVEAVNADVRTFLPSLADDSLDFVFASNFFEHFDWPDLERLIADVRRVLRPGGRLAVVQPNFRLNPGRYFDDYTHRAIFTDASLCDWLQAGGLQVVRCVPRFLPLTVKSRMGGLTALVPLYLRLPWRPLAGQMFVLVEKPAPGSGGQRR